MILYLVVGFLRFITHIPVDYRMLGLSKGYIFTSVIKYFNVQSFTLVFFDFSGSVVLFFYGSRWVLVIDLK